MKTLMDPQAASLPTAPTATTVDALISNAAPQDAANLAHRVPPFETTLWTLRVLLLGYRLEADSDVHLILADPSNPLHTIIGEIPASFCTDSSRAPAFSQARESIVAIGAAHSTLRWCEHVGKRWCWLDYRGAHPPLVRISGYGFFDTPHSQTGASSNNAELHPIIKIEAL